MYNVGQTLIPAPAGQLHRNDCNILLVKMTRSFESRISRLLVKIISVKIVMLTDNFIIYINLETELCRIVFFSQRPRVRF